MSMVNENNLGLIYRPRVRNALVGTLLMTHEQMHEAWVESDKQMSDAYMIVGVVTYSIVLRNEIIINYVNSTINDIKNDRDFYKHETKKAVKNAEDIAMRYTSMCKGIIKDNEELEDSLKEITQQYEANIKNQLLIFYYALKQAMDSNNVDKSVLRANVEFCSVLLQIALDSQQSVEESNILLRDRIRNLGYLKLTTLSHAWEKVRFLINGKYHDKNVDLNTDRCKQSCKNLQKAMSNFKMISDLMCN